MLDNEDMSTPDGEGRFNPFPGLRAFEPDEDHLFFGREEQIDELLVRLRKNRFLSVVGTSGSGKSSLIRSGLIPSLYSGFMTQAGSSWRVAVMRPGSDPIGNLADALNDPEVLGSDPELADMTLRLPPSGVTRALLETTLHRSAQGLVEAVRQARLPAGENLLILADQFEELFRFKVDPRIKDAREEALAFVKLLLEAGQQDEVPIYVVITMRSDFIGNCTELTGLAEAINDGQYLVPRMTREERRAAIVGPVAVGGAEITPRLVLRLLNDVGDNLDQLPILQHALMRTWNYWQEHHGAGEPIDLRHYEATGTMQEALSQHAEEAYRELDGAGERRICELMFKGLTDAGSDPRGVRRPIPLAEICELTGAGAGEVVAVIDRFRTGGRTFLMPPAGVALAANTVIDISHESLMRTWKRLIGWVADEARSAQTYLQLSEAAARYQEGKAGLYRDPELQIALNWRDKARPTATWARRYDVAYERAMQFLKYSQKEYELEIAEKERQRQKQLKMARRMMFGMLAVALIVLGFGMYSMVQKARAEEARSEAEVARNKAEEARRLAERKTREVEIEKARVEEEKARVEEERERAEQQQRIAEEERRRAEQEEERAREQEQKALEQKAEAERARRQAEAAESEARKQRAAAEKSEAAAIESEAEAQRLRMIDLGHALALEALRLQEDHPELAALLALQAHRLNRANGGATEDSSIFNALHSSLHRLAPERERVFRFPRDGVRSLALEAGGRTLAVGSDDGTVSLVDTGAGTAEPAWSAAVGSEVRSVALGVGWLAAGAFDGSIRVWQAARTGAEPKILAGHGASVAALAFDSAGGRLASAGAGGQVGLWDPSAGPDPTVMLDAPGVAAAVAFSPGDETLAAATDAGLALWPVAAAPDAPAAIVDPGRDVTALAFQGGGVLAAGTRRGTILLWDLRRSPPALLHELSGHQSAVTDLSFSAGDRLASSSLDGTVRLWDVSAPNVEPVVLSDHIGWVWAVALDAGGDRAFSGSGDRSVRVWEVRTETLAGQVCRRAGRNLSAEEWQEHLPAVDYQATCPELPAADSPAAIR